MKKLLHYLSTLLMDSDGKHWSSIRFNMLFIGILSSLCYWIGWFYICWNTKQIPDMPTTLTGAYLTIVGIVCAVKVAQSRLVEKDDNQKIGE